MASLRRRLVVFDETPWNAIDLNFVKLIFLIAKGLIRDPKMRRQTMFWVALGAIGMVFFGTLFSGALEENPWLFAGYWAGCAWLTLLMLMLAVYDGMAVRAALLAEERKLAAEFFGSSSAQKKHK